LFAAEIIRDEITISSETKKKNIKIFVSFPLPQFKNMFTGLVRARHKMAELKAAAILLNGRKRPRAKNQ